MKNFITINEDFICKNCRHQNPPAEKTCRNHCRNCLYSMHVDDKIPGDRKSGCKGMMPPIELDQNGKKGWIIYHKCKKCGKVIPNKALQDDNFDEIIKLSRSEDAEGGRAEAP